MRVITYLGFTFLSILIQFCVMDFIQEKVNNKTYKEQNLTSPSKQFVDILNELTKKPYALYFKDIDKINDTKTSYRNESVPENTETSTIVIEFYEDNATNLLTTTEIYNTKEYENSTEFMLFDKLTTTTLAPSKNTYQHSTKVESKCNCDFKYKVCDVNCCCDNYCTKEEISLFQCGMNTQEMDNERYYCESNYFNKLSSMANMFCIAKTNLPEKRNYNNKYKESNVDKIKDQSYKWNHRQIGKTHEFVKKVYQYGDPIWILKNSTVAYAELPTPKLSDYCNGRKPMKFFRDESFECVVKFNDLEIFQIFNYAEESFVISMTNVTLNTTSSLNCSNAHCTPWDLVVCDDSGCANYNSTLHEANCKGNNCMNVALEVNYLFYYHESKITNATIKLHVQTLSVSVQKFFTQVIDVKFFLANQSAEDIIEISGNPGYRHYLPVIAMKVGSNRTESFFNNTKLMRHLSYPKNNMGECVLTNLTHNLVLFNTNKILKCRYNFHKYKLANMNITCSNLQNAIYTFLNINEQIFVCPFGDPRKIVDDDWLPINTNQKQELQDTIDVKSSTLYCSEFIIGLSYVFTIADVSSVTSENEYKILSSSMNVLRKNITFSTENLSIVLSFDVNFIDVTKPPLFEFAGSPHINIHLPKDFFFPFFSNKSSCVKINHFTVIFFLLIIKKIYS